MPRLTPTRSARYGLDLLTLALLAAVVVTHEGPPVLHSLVGVALGAGLGLHLAWNWRWMVGVAGRFLDPRLPGRTRLSLAVDAVAGLSLAGTVLSGLALAPWMPWRPDFGWTLAHHTLPKLFLFASLVHIAQHAGWLWRESAGRWASAK